MCEGVLSGSAGNEVVVFEEVAAELGHEEHDDREQRQEDHHAERVLDRVIRMERDAVDRMSVGAEILLDLDAVRIVRSDFVQRHDVRGHEPQQHERNRDHVEREEAVERRIRHDIVAADPERELGADQRQRIEQIDDHLRAPVRHLSPRQQIAEERFGHQHEVDQHAEDPHQLARMAVRAVEQRAEHVQIDDDEEKRSARRVHVADQPPARHVAHDVFDGRESLRRIGLVMHGEEDAGRRSGSPAPAWRASRSSTRS